MRNGVARLATLLLLMAAPALAGDLLGEGHDSCSSCHFGAQGSGESARPDAAVCTQCHDPSSMQPAPMGTDPWPAHYRPEASMAPNGDGGSDCLVCHDPHAAGGEGRLRQFEVESSAGVVLDSRSRLCVQCHATHAEFGGGFAYTRHPVGVPVPGGMRSPEPVDAPLSDVAGTEDEADDVISCMTCHTVHQRREKNLLRWAGREGMIAGCTSCHDLSGAGRGALISAR